MASREKPTLVSPPVRRGFTSALPSPVPYERGARFSATSVR